MTNGSTDMPNVKPWTEKELQHLRENWRKKPLTEIAEEMGRSYASVRNKAEKEAIRTPTVTLTEEQLKICRQYAEDPNLTQAELQEKLGYGQKSRRHLVWILRCHGIEWQAAKNRFNGVGRQFTPAELSTVREYAADPSKTRGDLRRALRTNSALVNHLIESCGVDWVTARDARLAVPHETISTLRRLAADNRISRDIAAKQIGITVSHLRQLCEHHGIKWMAACTREYSNTRQRQDPPGGHTTSSKRAATQAEKRPRIQPKKMPKTNSLSLSPEKMNGLTGYRWHSPEINGGGWISATTRADAEREAQRIVGLALQRRHAA